MKRVETVLKRFGFVFDGTTENGSRKYKNTSINRSVYMFSEKSNRFIFNGNISYCDDRITLEWISEQCTNENTLRYAVLGFFMSGDAF